jgi:hypothetical protein
MKIFQARSCGDLVRRHKRVNLPKFVCAAVYSRHHFSLLLVGRVAIELLLCDPNSLV